MTAPIVAPSDGPEDAPTWTRFHRWISEVDRVDLAMHFALIALILASHYEPTVMVGVAVMAVLALAQPAVRHHPAFWFVGAAALLAWQVPRWHEFDDHVLLATWWVLGIGCCLLTSAPEASMRRSARWMVGIIFGLAVAWKLGSDDFRSGRFFEHALLLDDRFSFVAQWIGGVDEATRVANHEAAQGLAREPTTWVPLQTGRGVRALALVFSVWGIVVEATLAATWLLPLRRRWRWLRHAALLAFMGTTYLVVPIGGFGCLLIALAVTQDDELPKQRLVYAAAFAALAAYGPIWAAVFGP